MSASRPNAVGFAAPFELLITARYASLIANASLEVIPSDCASALVIDPARAKATSPPFRPHPTAFPNAGMLGKLPGARLSTWAACFVVIAAAPFVAPRLAP